MRRSHIDSLSDPGLPLLRSIISALHYRSIPEQRTSPHTQPHEPHPRIRIGYGSVDHPHKFIDRRNARDRTHRFAISPR